MQGRRSLRIGIAVFALLVAASPPLRADYRSAVSAYENGAYEAALGEFRTLAQSGDPAAQYHLGLMFKDGRGVRKDPVAALGWFLCAAGSGAAGSDGANSDGAGPDGQVGTDAARSVEQLSSALDPASVSAAQERARDCRAIAESPAPQPTGEESERPGGTGEGSERPGGTGEWPERPDIANPLDWETFKAKLSEFFGMLSGVEVASAESSPSFFFAPTRRSVWSRAFFLPADGTLVGSQHVAWELGARDLYRDLRGIARNDNNIALGLFAVLWWLLIGKTMLSMGGALLRIFRRSGLE